MDNHGFKFNHRQGKIKLVQPKTRPGWGTAWTGRKLKIRLFTNLAQ